MKAIQSSMLFAILFATLALGSGCAQETDAESTGTLLDSCTGEPVGVVLEDGSFELNNGIFVPASQVFVEPELEASACWDDSAVDSLPEGDSRLMKYVAVSGGCVTMQTPTCAASCCIWCTSVNGCTSSCESTC